MPNYDVSNQTLKPSGLLRFIQGAIIGCCAVLPGISGGVLSVTFGVYRIIVSFIAHPILRFRSCLPDLFPLAIGWCVGFFGIAKLVDIFMASYTTLLVCLFIGLIIGNFPALIRDAAKEKGKADKKAWISLAISFVVMLLFFVVFDTLNAKEGITPNTFWYFVCGIMWGVSCIMPGMSFTSVMIFIGIYYDQIAGLANFDLAVIVPIGVGAALSALSLAKAVNRLLDRHYTVTFFGIIGIVAASTVVIIPRSYQSAADFFLSLIVALAGFAISFSIDRIMGKKAGEPGKEENS